MAYRLKLPEHVKIHPVFHVSLLKKVIGTTDHVSSPFPPDLPDVQILENIFDERVTARSNRLQRQLLIKWHNLPPEMVT